MRRRLGWLLLFLFFVAPLAAAAADRYPVSEFPSPRERAFWRKHIKTLMLRPGCCGSCPALVPEDFRRIALVIGTNARDSRQTRDIWVRYGTRLARIIDKQDRAVYREFEQIRLSEIKQESKGAFR